tara:strand:+ start:411 stop:1610 length:1200 start_codon:yes stop_codon:yes gene_type:complete
MNKLSQYSNKEQDFIIDIGLFNYKKSKQFIEKNNSENYYEKWENEDNKKQLLSLKEKIFDMEKEFNVKMDEKIQYYKTKIEKSENERESLLKIFENNVNMRVSETVKGYKERIVELEKKNKYYYDLYIVKEKGINYEEELGDLLKEYNTKYFNDVWKITHVGQLLSGKGDFNMYHKDLKCNILLDMKNNLSHKPVTNIDIEKFRKDVFRNESNFVAGIMIANNNICTKKCFEFEKVKDKFLLYISNYDKKNIGFLYSILNIIIERIDEKSNKIDENDIKNAMKEQYIFLKNMLSSNNKQKRKIEEKIEGLINKYKQYFKDDLEINTEKTKVLQKKDEEMIVDFEKLEEGRKKVGKRSKYWLIYDKNGKETVQYFQGNHTKNKKLEKLEKMNQKIIKIDI